jgi:IclR family transcriptional regulator, acetate operon repressor
MPASHDRGCDDGDMSDASPAGRPPAVQSVARAIALLRCFEHAGPDLTLTDLARATGLTMSTAYRLAATLVEGGLLAREPGHERYQLGPTLVALARTMTGPAHADRAVGILTDLARRTGESASLGVGEGRNVVVLEGAGSSHSLRFDRAPGTLVPVHASAMGKALLAFGAESHASAVKVLAPLARLTPRTLTAQRALVADLEVTRERGFALVDEEQLPGVRSLAVPVLGTDGFAIAAVGIQGPISRIVDDDLRELADATADAAHAIEALAARGYVL